MNYSISTSTEWENGWAFSAIRADGTVSLWGDLLYGSNFAAFNRFPTNLRDITQVYSNGRGFYAIRADGTLFADYAQEPWTFKEIRYHDVADKLVNIVAISTTTSNVAALTSGGAVVYFGYKTHSPKAVHPRLQDGVTKVFTTSEAFAALKNDGSVVVWGTDMYGAGADGEVYEYLESGVVNIVSTKGAFAALKSDGSVIQWGLGGYEPPQGLVATGIKKIFSNGQHFMFLTEDGSVKTSSQYAFEPQLSLRLASGIVDIISTNEYSFTALKEDGSIVSFLVGLSEYPGGFNKREWVEIGTEGVHVGWIAGIPLTIDKWDHTEYLENTKRIKDVVGNSTGYAALSDDGSVITWGYITAIAPKTIKDKLASGVNKIFSNNDSFAALKDDGSVITWGSREGNTGADSRSVADLLKSDVTTLSGHAGGFIALKKDGSVVFWGKINSFDYSIEGPYVALGDINTNQFIIPAATNAAPTNIAISALTFAENIAGGSSVAMISSADADSVDTHVYSLVAGDGNMDNDSFEVSDNELKIKASPDYETKSSYAIRLRTTDASGLTFDQSFTLSVSDVNEVPAPVPTPVPTPIPTPVPTPTPTNNGNGTPGAITGNGAFREGVILNAPVVTGDPDGDSTNPNYSYQWYKGSTAISNATASTFAVPASGAGTYKVAVTYTDAQGFTATLDSPDQVVSTFNNGNGTPASITGNGLFREGVTLTAPVVTGDPDGDALSPNYSYQWFKGSTAITNATASTYVVPVTGAGTYKVAVTYTDAQGFTATLDSPEQAITEISIPSYKITPSATSINEGATLTTSVATTNVASGTTLYYSFSGTGITAADFSAGALTGSGTVGTDGKFSISHTITNDLTTEGSESIEIKLFTDSSRTAQVGSTASVSISDTSKTPTPQVPISNPGITVRSVSGNNTTSETGTTATYSFVLNSAPTDPVTITLAISDGTEGSLSSSTLTFDTNNWNTAQVLTVTGLDDFENDGDIPYLISAVVSSSDPNYGPRRDGTGGVSISNIELTNKDDGLEKDVTLYGDSNTSNYNDVLNGSNGSDRLYGERGRDRLYGGRGGDRLYGGVDDDTLWGEDGDDDLYGNEDDDILYGGNGNDRLTGGEGYDNLIGGNGDDTYVIDDEFDVIDDQGLRTG